MICNTWEIYGHAVSNVPFFHCQKALLNSLVFKRSLKQRREVTEVNFLRLSANCRALTVATSKISFMKTLKRQGPRSEPRELQSLVITCGYGKEPIFTIWERSSRIWIHHNSLASMQVQWSTLSNAFCHADIYRVNLFVSKKAAWTNSWNEQKVGNYGPVQDKAMLRFMEYFKSLD